MATELHIRLEAMPESVPRARQLTREWSERQGATSTQLENIALAITEAVANIVRHAYPTAQPGPIHLDAYVRVGALVFSIRDEGIGPTATSPHAGLGVGLSILAEASDESTITATGNGTHLTLNLAAR